MAAGLSERQAARAVGASLSGFQDRRKAGLLSRSATQDKNGRWRYDAKLLRLEWEASTPLRATARGDGAALQAWREAKAKREAAEAELAQIKLAKEQGALVDAKAIEARIVDVFTRSRNKLLGVPSKLKQRLPHLSVEDVATVDEEIRECLEELADGVESGGKP
jgi:phage terminase Nu1 subunit (DNA packaging protein)